MIEIGMGILGMRRHLQAVALLLTAVNLLFGGGLAAQQTALAGFREISAMDNNYVDLHSGLTQFSLSDVSIGSGAMALGHMVISGADGFGQVYTSMPGDVIADSALKNGFFDNFSGQYDTRVESPRDGYDHYQCEAGVAEVIIGVSPKVFCAKLDGTYFPSRADGSALVKNADGTWTYTAPNGMVATYSAQTSRLERIAYPDGRIITINFRYESCGAGCVASRIQSVTQNNGLQLKYNYATNAYPPSGLAREWGLPISVTALNNAVDYCNPTADTCAYSRQWPVATYTWSGTAQKSECHTASNSPAQTCHPYSDFSYLTITDMAGRQTKYTQDRYGRTVKVEEPTGDVFDYQYCQPFHIGYSGPEYCATYTFTPGGPVPEIGSYEYDNDKAIYVWRNQERWTYIPMHTTTPSGTISSITATSPLGVQRSSHAFSLNNGRQGPSFLVNITDDDGTNQLYSQNLDSWPATLNLPSAYSEAYTRDARGNITQVRQYGTGLADVNRYAGYDLTCSNINTCNKPNWVKDGKGNQTDIVYEATGLMKSVTAPADSSGVRAQTRYFYAQRYAYIKNASGSYAQASSPIWLLTSESTCKTGAASGDGCAVAGDEVLTTYDYGPASGPNNLFLRGTAVTASGVTRRTCYAYDVNGNKISETSPRAGLASCP